MGNFKWLQFSDLHFRRRDSFDMSMARDALLSCLSEEKFKCDYIFITGDIANQNSYDSASEYMEKLLEITNVGKENVFWAVGNHDIKRGSRLRESIIDRIRKAKNPSQEFEATMADAEERSLLTYSGMSDYLKQYEDLFGRKLTADETSDAHVFYSLKHLNLLVLNTCLASCDNEDEHRLMITEHRLLQVFDKVDEKNKPLVVIGHHGKGFFYNSEQEKLAQLFDNAGVDMYLCGHSHRLGYARFDDAGRDIPQITCGGGLIDGYSVVSFMLGEYDDAARTVRITPYSYSDRGSRQFQKDYSLHRRLTESNNTFALERLGAATFAADDKRVSLADKDLFERSKRYYNFLRGEKGRFSFLELSEELFPDAKPFDTFLLGECEDQPQKLMEVLKNKPGSMIIVGEGGTGKTTALLNVWQELLAGGTELPLYVPLNEYKPQPEFLRNYIKLYYEKIDITCLARKYVLLLDGLNEISGDALPLVQEIKALLLQSEQIRIIVTSRSRFEPEHQLDKPFALYNLQPLDMGTVESFLQRNNLSLEKELGEVLQTPLMLTLYAQTSSVQKRVAQRKLFDFKPYEKRGELLYNYLLCQVANCVIHGRLEDIIPTWCALFAVAPYIAHHMEARSQFQIGKNEFAELLSSFNQMCPIEQQLSDMPLGIKEIVEKHKLREKAAVPVENVLLYQQYILVEEGDFYIFRHQYFRDFFAALRIANVIRESLCVEPFVLPSEAKEAWSVYVKDMLGDYYSDYQNKDAYKHPTPLHELLGKLRGMPCLETGWAINNIIETWRTARDGKIIGEDLSRLDLSRVPLNGVFFSNQKAASRFDGCVISDATILPQGHSDGVISAAYSPDGCRVISASSDRTVKEWDRESGQCLRTFEGHSDGVYSAAYSPDGRRVLSASYDRTVKEWDRGSGQCLRTFEGHSYWVCSAAYSPDGCRVISASFDGTVKEWDRESGQCLWTSPPYSGIYVAGCDFMGCRFSSMEIERLVYVYCGNVLSPTLHSIHSKTLRGEQREIDISLGGEPAKSLLIAGLNGSGKSSLLAGINQAVEAVLRNEATKEVAVAFSDREPAEAERVLRQEHETGYYLFKYFPANHSFKNAADEMPAFGKKRKNFWALLEGMHAEINQLRLDGNNEGADSLEMWLGRISESFEGLFAGEVKLRQEKDGYHVDRIFEDRVQELNLDHLPDGYSAIIDIFNTIIVHWRDDIIPFNRIRGLVLIDELESHLHVRLQKHVLPFLTELLPGIQFIVATHSPYVLNSVANAVVYDMNRDKTLESVDGKPSAQLP
ncbi:MAG: AAA family ATPase [Clostridiales bacterium]|nr:AAA family ATPase [Clostridiales bacterium]